MTTTFRELADAAMGDVAPLDGAAVRGVGRRRTRLVLSGAAVAAAAVVAAFATLAGTDRGAPTVPPAASPSVAGGIFSFPDGWSARGGYRALAPGELYLSNQAMSPPCPRESRGPSCGRPFLFLDVHGVIAKWEKKAAYGAEFDAIPGAAETTPRGYAVKVHDRPVDETCRDLSGTRRIDVAVQVADEGPWYVLETCANAPTDDTLADLRWIADSLNAGD